MMHYAQAFTAFNQNTPDGWLKSQRIASFARFEYLGFPTKKVENWKYTSTQTLAEQTFNLATSFDLNVAQQCLAQKGFKLDAHRLVLVDGIFCPELSDLSAIPDGIIIQPLSASLEQELELTCGMMGRLAGIDVDVFTALNFAFVNEGAVVRLGRSQVLDKPLLISYISTSAQPVMSHPRVLVAAGTNSQAQIIEEFISASKAQNFTNRVFEVVMEKNSHITHTLVQQEADSDFWVGRIHTDQKSNSNYVFKHYNFGAQLSRDDVVSDLNGAGADSSLYGLLFGRNKQLLDAHTLTNHNAELTTSHVTYKTILNDSAHGVFNTRVVVKKDSQKISADQFNANLLLSDKSEIDTKPELEIYADDVQCAHGATTGQLDEQALFYLKSRGLDAEQAKGLLILAFANEVISQISQPEIAKLVEQEVAGHLPYDLEVEADYEA